MESNTTVAVIGAGISGLSCARALKAGGLAVTVFDKSRGTSGRMSTRRVTERGLQFDHGAQFFTAHSTRFRQQVAAWVAGGHAALWEGRFGTLGEHGFRAALPEARYVGTPRMSALGRHLAEGLTVRTGVRVTRVVPDRGGLVHAEDGSEERFDQVVVAVPSVQAVPLLAAVPTLTARAAEAEMAPCRALMLQFATPLDLPFDGVEVTRGPLSWIARDASKPGRPDAECWVAHASPEASRAHLEEDPQAAAARLVPAFLEAVGVSQQPTHAVSHRWRYARPMASSDDGCLYEPSLGIGACGDWLVGPRVEAAWRSGVLLAARILTETGARGVGESRP